MDKATEAGKPIAKRRLTRKQKIFADEYLNTGHITKSALKAYDTTDDNVAHNIGSDNLRKPTIQEYLADKSDDAMSMIYFLSQHSKQDFIKLNASKDILDRAGYKAIDRSINVNVDVKRDAKTLALIEDFEKKLDETLDDEARTTKP